MSQYIPSKPADMIPFESRYKMKNSWIEKEKQASILAWEKQLARARKDFAQHGNLQPQVRGLDMIHNDHFLPYFREERSKLPHSRDGEILFGSAASNLLLICALLFLFILCFTLHLYRGPAFGRLNSLRAKLLLQREATLKRHCSDLEATSNRC